MIARHELQRRLNDDRKLSNISILGYDPGWVPASSIFRDQTSAVKGFMAVMGLITPLLCRLLKNPLFRTPARNGRDVLRACFDKKEIGEYPKALYIDGTVITQTPKWANDEGQQKDVWKGSLELVGLKEGDTALENWT